MRYERIPAEVREGVSHVWGKVSQAFDRWMPRSRTNDTAPLSVERDAETFWPAFFPGRLGPDVELRESRDTIQVAVEIPGLEKDDIRVEVTGNRLTIRGEKCARRETRGEVSHLAEIRYGSVSRTLDLPAPVAVEKAKAQYRNGVLRLTLPKKDARDARQVKVRVS